jgi:anti-sigma factor RsiW
MNCKKASEITSDYIDGCLPHHAQSEYEAHISRCAECAAELDEMRRMLSSLSSLAVRDSSVDMWPGLRTVIMERGRPRPVWHFLLRPVIAAPAAALAAVLAAMLVLPAQMETPNVRSTVSMPEYGHYITAHSRFQRQQAFADPDISFAAAELEKARVAADGSQQ